MSKGQIESRKRYKQMLASDLIGTFDSKASFYMYMKE